MRMWSDVNVVFGTDHLGPGIIMQGNKTANIFLAADKWKLDPSATDSSRLWRPVNVSVIEKLQSPYPEGLPDSLSGLLSLAEPKIIHPAFEAGFEAEAERIYPLIEKQAVEQFRSFITYLKKAFHLHDTITASTALVPYVDGFGPQLFVKLGEEITPLPELPSVYLAPASWIPASFCVATSMIGPNVNQYIPTENSWVFSPGYKPADMPSEGLVYFHAAMAMIAWAAWEKNPPARFMTRICEMIMSGYRPLR